MSPLPSATSDANVEVSVTLTFDAATGPRIDSTFPMSRVALTVVTFLLHPDGRVFGRGRGLGVLGDGCIGSETYACTVSYDAMPDDIRLAVAEGLREAVRRAGDDVLALSRAVAEMVAVPVGGA